MTPELQEAIRLAEGLQEASRVLHCWFGTDHNSILTPAMQSLKAAAAELKPLLLSLRAAVQSIKCSGCGESYLECDCAIIHPAISEFLKEHPELGPTHAAEQDTREKEWGIRGKYGKVNGPFGEQCVVEHKQLMPAAQIVWRYAAGPWQDAVSAKEPHYDANN